MANAFSTNLAITSSSNSTNVFWRLTRVMKAAGWVYRASGDGSQKELTGVPTNDLFGTNANPLNDNYSATNTLTTGTLALPASSATLNVSSTTGFPASGTISVQTSANGWQQLTYTGGGGGGTSFTGVNGGTGSVPSGAEVTLSGDVSFEQVNAWWVASGPQTIKLLLNALPTGTPLRSETVTQGTSSATAELLGFVWDPVGATGWAVLGPQTAPQSTTMTSTTTLPAASLPVSSVTGFAPSGWLQVMTTTGLAVVYYTGTSGGNTFTGCSTTFTGTATSGNAVNGSATVFDGTHTLTGASSGATLNPLGTTVAAGSNTVNVNTFTGAGTLNVASTTGFPSVGTLFVTTGSGTAQITYTNTSGGNSFTGCTTASVSSGTPFSGTLTTGGAVQAAPVYYNREFVFSKVSSSQANGNVYYICADPQIEFAMFYSTLATSTGATATVWPGGGGTNNGFTTTSPVTGTALNLCVRGTGGSTAGSDAWFSGPLSYGASAQIGGANNIAATSVTADGSFYVGMSISVANEYTGLIFTRLDDTEPGDIDPYVYMGSNGNSTFSTFSRTTTTSYATTTYFYSNSNFFGGTYIQAMGYQARGNHAVTTRDVPYGWQCSSMWSPITATYYQSSSAANIRLVAHPATTAPLVREPVTFTTLPNSAGTFKQIKGRARWIQMVSIGNVLDTYDSKTWLNVYPYSNSTTTPAIIIGPYDGATTPSA